MQRIICDFCKTNTAEKQFKVKELIEMADYEFGHVIGKPTWVTRDICQKCYDKLFKIPLE